MKVVVTFTPAPEAADPNDDTGLTNAAYEALFDAIPGEDVRIERDDSDDKESA